MYCTSQITHSFECRLTGNKPKQKKTEASDRGKERMCICIDMKQVRALNFAGSTLWTPFPLEPHSSWLGRPIWVILSSVSPRHYSRYRTSQTQWRARIKSFDKIAAVVTWSRAKSQRFLVIHLLMEYVTGEWLNASFRTAHNTITNPNTNTNKVTSFLD